MRVDSYSLLLVYAMIAVLLLTLQVVLASNVRVSVELCCDRGASSTQSRVVDHSLQNITWTVQLSITKPHSPFSTLVVLGMILVGGGGGGGAHKA